MIQISQLKGIQGDILSATNHHLCTQKLALVAVGNTLRMDDGIAQRICNQLSAECLQDVCYLDAGQCISQIPAFVQHHDIAVIVDACDIGLTPGSTSIIDLKPMLEKHKLNMVSSHGLSFIDELALASQTDPMPQKIYLFAIQPQNISWGHGISDHLEPNLDTIADSLRGFLTQLGLQM